MSKHSPDQSGGPGSYEPQEFTLRFPDKPILDAHWSNVWTDSFKQAVAELLGEPKEKTLAADLSLGVEVLRLAQICGQSLKNGGQVVKDIALTPDQSADKTKWITMSSDAQINGESLVAAAREIGNAVVVGNMPGKAGKAGTFAEKYPEHPSREVNSVDEIIEQFDSNTPLAFYYPSVPH